MSGDSANMEQALRDEVRRIWDSGNHEGLTVKRVRKAVEEELDLPHDFFKNDDVWKDHSKEIITHQVELQEQQPAPQDEAASSADEIKSPPKPKGGRKKNAEQPAKPAKAPRKRAPAQPKPTARKKRKVSIVSDESADEAISDHNSPEPTMAETADPDPDSDTEEKNTSVNVKKQSPNDDNDEDDDADGPNVIAKPSNEPTENAADSESELSSLLDEPPPPKAKRQKKSAAGEKKPAKPKATKAKQEKEVDPQDAEIKRLQGWLVKCGIRKVWGKELKPYTTPREKINHLKAMLKDAGMDGRYSVEKARQIKERRELAADLEAVQEGNKKWGQSDEEEENDKGRPRRRLARGLKDLEGLIDEDGEESD
ncbi:putative transcriptional regulator [Phyllosticta citribraziliensis]|uniref:Transcriptional regulator n=1 Tax=Phyllosticta citribraziliensis TaxID=989973 RepID=A0ABR1LEG4_9PEZI